MLFLTACRVFAGTIDRHPELKSRAVAWTPYDGSFLVDTSSRAEVLNFFWTVLAAPYPSKDWTGSIEPPVAGQISELYRLREYAQVNAYRALNYSGPMHEDPSKIPMVQATALVFVLNYWRGTSHTIDSSWIGYNELAAEGAATSLLGGGNAVTRNLDGAVDGFVYDGGPGNKAEVGHRTVLLHDATITGTLGVAHIENQARSVWKFKNDFHTTDPTQFVAWPSPGYVPRRLFGPYEDMVRELRWSFALQDDSAVSSALRNAAVSVSVNGAPVTVKNVVRNWGMYPITWSFDPVEFDLATAPDGTEVEITISNIVGVPFGDVTSRAYRYKVTIIDENKIVPAGFSPKTPLVNISTRGTIGSGERQMIAGFWVDGTLPVRVAVRTQGPGLARHGIRNPARKTRARIYDSEQTLIGENAGWKEHQDWRFLESLGVAPGADDEAGMVLTLWPGGYTAVVSDDTGVGGVGLVEVFNIDNLTPSRLSNISTRGVVETGEGSMIAGFIVKDTARTVVIRTQGSALSRWIADAVPDTLLSVFAQGGDAPLAMNDDWRDAPQNARFLTDLAGFAPADNRESALVLRLAPGAYTALVSAKGSGGVGIVEIFDLGP